MKRILLFNTIAVFLMFLIRISTMFWQNYYLFVVMTIDWEIYWMIPFAFLSLIGLIYSHKSIKGLKAQLKMMPLSILFILNSIILITFWRLLLFAGNNLQLLILSLSFISGFLTGIIPPLLKIGINRKWFNSNLFNWIKKSSNNVEN